MSTTSRPRPCVAICPRSSAWVSYAASTAAWCPPSSLSLIESGIRERDQVNTETKERIARAALDRLPPAGGTILLDAGSTTVRLATAPPAGPRAHGRHPRGPDRRAAGRPAPPRPPRCSPGASVGPRRRPSAPTPSRRSPTSASTSRSSAPTASPPTTGSPRPIPTRPRSSGRSSACGHLVVALADASKFGLETAVRFASPRRHRRRGHRRRRRPERRPGEAGIEVADRKSVVARRGGDPHDRHPDRQPQPRPHGQPDRSPRARRRPAGRVGDLAGRRQGREHLPRLCRRRPADDRRAARCQGRPVRARAARGRHRLPTGAARGRPAREHHDHRARRHHHQAQQPRAAGDPGTARGARATRSYAVPAAPTGSSWPARCRPAPLPSGTPSWSPPCEAPAHASPSTPATHRSRRSSTRCRTTRPAHRT